MSIATTYEMPKRMAKLTVRPQTLPTTAPSDVAIRRRIRFGVRAGLLGLGVALLWAALVPIGGAVIAPGSVTVRGESKAVQHLEGGIVDRIYVEDGQRVESGQPLLQMNPVQSTATMDDLRHKIFEASIKESRLSAELAGEKTFDLKPGVLDALASSGDPDFERLLLAEMQLQQERAINQTLLVNQAESNVRQIQAQVTGIKAQLASTRKQNSLIAQELSGIRTLYQQGYATVTRVLSYERAMADLGGQAEKAEASLAEHDQLLQQQTLALSRVQVDFKRSVLEDLSQTRQSLKELQEKLKAANDVQGRTTIRAPADGVVTALAVHTVGEVVPGGKTLMQVVPSDQGFMVEARARPEDIEQIKAGSPAKLQFGAYRNLRRDLVDGKVAYVAADAADDARSGARYFKLRIAVDPQDVASSLDLALQPGMPVTAYVETQKRTAFAYLLSPISNMLLRSLRE